jgi:hypothetical protein
LQHDVPGPSTGNLATPARTGTGTSAGGVLLLDATPDELYVRFPALADDVAALNTPLPPNSSANASTPRPGSPELPVVALLFLAVRHNYVSLAQCPLG